MKIYFRVLSSDTTGCHSRLSRYGLCLQYLQLCGLHIVICCILSRSLARGCFRSKGCQPSPALRLQGELWSFNNVPIACQHQRKYTEENVLFPWEIQSLSAYGDVRPWHRSWQSFQKKHTTCDNESVHYVRKISTQLGTFSVCHNKMMRSPAITAKKNTPNIGLSFCGTKSQ